MCEIFSKQPIEAYSSQTRSVRLSGHATSIRLEGAYWKILEEMARKQDMSLGRFLSLMYDEVLELTNDEESISSNFTSLLRCACLTYSSKVKEDEMSSTPHFKVKQCVNS
ncbi:MAG: ribbon-helix-helix domain-containing protein [Hyphomicrobiales bacterium]